MKPYKNKIQIEIEKPTAGALDLSSKPTGNEYGKIIAIGEDVDNKLLGKHIYYKAWALDIITHKGKTLYFISDNSEGICATE